MQIEISIEDMIDNVHQLPDRSLCALEDWFRQFLFDDDSITLKKIENEIEIQLERTLRGAIEGVTNLQPERIIIDLKKE